MKFHCSRFNGFGDHDSEIGLFCLIATIGLGEGRFLVRARFSLRKDWKWFARFADKSPPQQSLVVRRNQQRQRRITVLNFDLGFNLEILQLRIVERFIVDCREIFEVSIVAGLNPDTTALPLIELMVVASRAGTSTTR